MNEEPLTPGEEYELRASLCYGGPHAAEVARIKELAFDDDVLLRIRGKAEIDFDDQTDEALCEFAEQVAEFCAGHIDGDDPDAEAHKDNDAFIVAAVDWALGIQGVFFVAKATIRSVTISMI